MIKLFKKLFKKRYASNYYDLTNWYCGQCADYLMGTDGYSKYYTFKNIYISYGVNCNEIYVEGNSKLVLVCKIYEKTSTSTSGPFSSTTTIGTIFDWKCDYPDQLTITKILNEMDDHLLEKDRIRKEKEDTEKIYKEEKHNKRVSKLLSNKE